ncbi:aminoglycoside phosphotransferase family protein [Nocardioides sp. WL0053]|uniref:Aminoglycoside phosphotransferase family protein n=1 Tax=Nocardioides jiangsuensis TaxID=2866161 RepID=A0ABS7RG25_9ACTN|nr:phosphotransferase [Nocardioides jiangsuensis]MBY9073986.1 aminoglycoside phosphotransferase family protein [Nocardioides jiangsuensis]
MDRLTDLDHAARRAQRHAAAAALLEDLPPLDALPVHAVAVDRTAVVHASRSRPVVRWDLTVESAHGEAAHLPVIGKAFVKGDGEQAWRLLRRLRAAGFDDPVLQVPEPFGFDPARHLLAQEEAPPVTLHALLQDELDDALPAVRRVATWLARLHAVPGADVPALPAHFESHKLTEYATALAGELPWAADRVRDLTALTVHRLDRAASDPAVLTHGDFQPKNVHLDQTRVVVIDFDRAALAPAARDLGHFLGQTLTMGAAMHGHLGAAAAWGRELLDGYVDAGGDPGAVRSTPGYVARTFAEVLFYRLVVRPVGTEAFVPAWLDAWEQHLDADGERP